MVFYLPYTEEHIHCVRKKRIMQKPGLSRLKWKVKGIFSPAVLRWMLIRVLRGWSLKKHKHLPLNILETRPSSVYSAGANMVPLPSRV